MKFLFLAIVAALVSSCAGIREWAANQGREAAKEYLEREGPPLIEKGLTKLAPEEAPAWKAAADVNKDQQTTLDEWWVWLTGGGFATILAYLARRVVTSDQKASRKRGEQWEAIEATKADLTGVKMHLAAKEGSSPPVLQPSPFQQP